MLGVFFVLSLQREAIASLCGDVSDEEVDSCCCI